MNRGRGVRWAFSLLPVLRDRWRRHRPIRLGLAIIVLLALGWGLGRLFAPHDRGSVSRHLDAPPRIEGRQVPLPPGDWRVMARSPADSAEPESALASLVLFRLKGRDVDAAILAQANHLGRRVAWGLPAACGQEAFTPRRVLYASDHDGACAYAAYFDGSGALTGIAIDPAWRAALREAVDRGWNVPATWIGVVFRVTDPEDSLQLRYLFHPWAIERARPPESAAWRRVQADRLAVWMESAAASVSAGFRDRLPPGVASRLAEPDRAPRRDGAHESNHVSDVAGDSARIMAEHAVSLRILATLADFGVMWAYLGSPATAGVLAGLRLAMSGAVWTTGDYARSWLSPPTARRDPPSVGMESPLPR
jgi:hypothetical protein